MKIAIESTEKIKLIYIPISISVKLKAFSVDSRTNECLFWLFIKTKKGTNHEISTTQYEANAIANILDRSKTIG